MAITSNRNYHPFIAAKCRLGISYESDYEGKFFIGSSRDRSMRLLPSYPLEILVP